MAAGAAFSGSVAIFCLGSGLLARAPGPILGFLTALVAAVALARARVRFEPHNILLRLPEGRLELWSERGDGEELRPVGITRNLICLSSASGRRLTIWRDSVAPDDFRRIATLGRWRRSAAANPGYRTELIARKTVTARQSASRSRPWSR